MPQIKQHRTLTAGFNQGKICTDPVEANDFKIHNAKRYLTKLWFDLNSEESKLKYDAIGGDTCHVSITCLDLRCFELCADAMSSRVFCHFPVIVMKLFGINIGRAYGQYLFCFVFPFFFFFLQWQILRKF